jgi:hypothetical protein
MNAYVQMMVVVSLALLLAVVLRALSQRRQPGPQTPLEHARDAVEALSPNDLERLRRWLERRFPTIDRGGPVLEPGRRLVATPLTGVCRATIFRWAKGRRLVNHGTGAAEPRYCESTRREAASSPLQSRASGAGVAEHTVRRVGAAASGP